MKQSTETPEICASRTRAAFMLTRILNTPFWAMFSMLPFILYKDLHATPLQVTALITLKPLVSIFSTYWSALINKRRDRLLANVIWACILGYLPFFFFPFIDNPWFFVLSSGIYMTLAQRGVIPAWMEILKLNIPHVSRGRVFAFTSAFGYIGDAIFPFVLGWLLDGYFQAWRWIFPCTALVSMAAIFFQGRIPIRFDNLVQEKTITPVLLYQKLVSPWKNAWEIIRRRPDFARFQVGFMLGGGGLMIMQPALPGFFVDVLNLSYTELAIAITLCKGIGFALTSPFWAEWINKVDIYRFSSGVTLLACAFPLFLIAAQADIVWLYLAYLCYGIMQAGSELSWNMSGPIFAKEEDSTAYSSINVLSVGVRGCFAPAIGSLAALWFNSTSALLLGGFLCLLANLRMAYYSKEAQAKNVVSSQ
jgi:hypothetical protein